MKEDILTILFFSLVLLALIGFYTIIGIIVFVVFIVNIFKHNLVDTRTEEIR